jgi:hypothetical protein
MIIALGEKVFGALLAIAGAVIIFPPATGRRRMI